MRTIIVSLLLGLLALNAYSQEKQSKLLGAGKGTKVGTVTPPKKGDVERKKTENKGPQKHAPNLIKNKTKADPDEQYASAGYMEITGISFANIDRDGHIIDDYGSNLYASEVKYLRPKLFYKGLASEDKTITLYIKIFDEDGKLDTGTGSPDGYTRKEEINVLSGSGQSIVLHGWGTNKGGSYKTGVYRFEIWYNENILYQKNIRFYSGSTPVTASRLIKIDSLAFGNVDKESNYLTPIGAKLYEDELRYLKPKMYYHGLSNSTQNLTLYYRIYDSTGTMVCGDSSPSGYSQKENVTIKYGYNTYYMSGWGTEKGGTYKSGTNKYEVWLDGEKIYETTFWVYPKKD